jgi:hypothetical protein
MKALDTKTTAMKASAAGLGSSNADRGDEGDRNDDGSSHQ